MRTTGAYAGQLPWGQRGRRLGAQAVPDVFVYCDACERWIAHEDRHVCELSTAELDMRKLLRVVKVRELMNR